MNGGSARIVMSCVGYCYWWRLDFDLYEGLEGMPQRNIYMDVLSVLSCLAVVYLHCSTVVFLNEGDLLWSLSVVVQSVFSFAVPVFFMMSGANLIGYREKYDTKSFLKKRLKRVIVPLLGFSLLYYVLSCCAPDVFGLPMREPSISGFVTELLTNRICDVYWFLYSITALYLMTPLISRAANDRGLLEYLLVLSFVSTAVVPLVNRFAPTDSLLSLLAIPYLTGPIFFYLLGYYIQRYVEVNCKVRSVLACSLFASLVAMIGMTFKTNYWHTAASGQFAEFDNFYLSIQNLLCVVYSCSIFGLMKGVEPKLQKNKFFHGGIFRLLTSVTLYVYLIHMLFINLFDVYVPHSITWDLGVRPPLVFLSSVAFGLVLSVIKTAIEKIYAGVSGIVN